MEVEVRWPLGLGCPAAEGAGGREPQADEASGRSDARQRHVEGPKRKKNGDARREAASCGAPLPRGYEVSQRRACQVISADRTSMRLCAPGCVSVPLSDAVLGIGGCYIMLHREGMLVNHKKLRRVYREERLQARRHGGRKRALGSKCARTRVSVIAGAGHPGPVRLRISGRGLLPSGHRSRTS